MAFSTNAADLDKRAASVKTSGLSRRADSPECFWSLDLGHPLAIPADKGDGLLSMLVPGHAGEKRVPALQAMNEAGTLQHVQDAVNRNWSEALAFFREAFDQIVSADGLMVRRDMPEDLLAESCPFDALFEAFRFRAPKRLGHADRVIVIARRK